MGSAFVYGLINAIDGEQDPRILLQIFQFVPHVLRTFPLMHLTEEMFEVCACYFPVDFNPSPEDPANIGRESLAAALAQCLAGHRDFAEYSVPLLLEKLDSQLVVAKIDALNLLRLVAEKFNVDDMNTYFPTIWTALHAEIASRVANVATRTTPSSDVVMAALSALQSIVCGASYLAVQDPNEMCAENVLVSVFESIIGSLSDTMSTHFELSLRIACTCARASKKAATFAYGKCMPLLLAELETFTDDSRKTSKIYEYICEFLEACLVFGDHEQMDAETLHTFQDKLIDGLQAEADDAHSLPVCLTCLSKIAQTLNIRDKRQTIYERIDVQVLTGPTDVAPQLKELLIALARHYASELNEILLDRWFQRRDAALDVANAKSVLEAIAGLAGVASFTDRVVAYLFRNIADVSAAEVVQHAAFDCLIGVLNELSFSDYQDTFSHSAMMLTKHLREGSNSDSTYLKIVVCLWTIMKKSSLQSQSKMYHEYMPTVPWSRPQDVYLVVGLMMHANRDVDVGAIQFDASLRELARICMTDDNPTNVQLCQHTICSMVNKAPSSKETDSSIESLVKSLQSELAANDVRVLRTLSWLAKGLLLRGHAQGFAIVEMVSQIF